MKRTSTLRSAFNVIVVDDVIVTAWTTKVAAFLFGSHTQATIR